MECFAGGKHVREKLQVSPADAIARSDLLEQTSQPLRAESLPTFAIQLTFFCKQRQMFCWKNIACSRNTERNNFWFASVAPQVILMNKTFVSEFSWLVSFSEQRCELQGENIALPLDVHSNETQQRSMLSENITFVCNSIHKSQKGGIDLHVPCHLPYCFCTCVSKVEKLWSK